MNLRLAPEFSTKTTGRLELSAHAATALSYLPKRRRACTHGGWHTRSSEQESTKLVGDAVLELTRSCARPTPRRRFALLRPREIAGQADEHVDRFGRIRRAGGTRALSLGIRVGSLKEGADREGDGFGPPCEGYWQ